MARVKIYAEIEVAMDVDIEGLDEDTMEYEVQQKKPEVYQALRSTLEGAFGDGLRKIDYVEFDVIRGDSDG